MPFPLTAARRASIIAALRPALASALAGLLLGAVYTVTLLPGVGHSGDTAEFQTAGFLLGTTHPTGNPGYLMLNAAFTHALPMGSVAWRANLLSAVFSAAMAVLLVRLLVRLGVPAGCAALSAVAFGLTPTLWRYSVVAEVYTLHLLFLTAVTLTLVRWRQERRERDFYAACALYALSFGNHLMGITLLPALAFFVFETDRRVFLQGRRIAAVLAIIALAALQYLYPVWRSREPTTPYLAWSTPDLATLWPYMTGLGYTAGMFQAPASAVLARRLPGFLAVWGYEWWPLVPVAVVGLLSWRDRALGTFLALVAAATLVLALNYEIADPEAYYLPVFWVTAILFASGLHELSRRVRGWAFGAAAAAAIPLLLAAFHGPRVEREKNADAPRRVLEFLAAVERGEAPPSLLVAGYHEYQYLLHYLLVEGRGRGRLRAELTASTAELRDYVAFGVPLFQRHLRIRIPPGLTVYATKGRREQQFRDAGLDTTPAGWQLYEIRAAGRRPARRDAIPP